MTGRPRLVALRVGAAPGAWAAAGFAVEDGGRVRVGATELVLEGGDGGLRGWTLHGAIPAQDGIDGLPTDVAPQAEEGRAPLGHVHPNGVAGIDHVVVSTPDTARAFEAFEAAGLELRRVRDAGTPQRPLRQGLLLTQGGLVEGAGPPDPPGGDAAHAPAAFWGITCVAALDVAARALGDRLGAPRDAVQAGRRIAIVDRAAGLGLPVALMTPRAS